MGVGTGAAVCTDMGIAITLATGVALGMAAIAGSIIYLGYMKIIPGASNH